MITNNVQNTRFYSAKQVSFKSTQDFERLLINDRGKITKKSAKLLKALEECIENEWIAIKKNGKLSNKPQFHFKDGKSSVCIEPIYSLDRPTLLIDSTNGVTNQKVLIDRINPNNFRYEKNIKTDHGSATLKTYNSILDDNKDVDKYVNHLIETGVQKIVRDNILHNLLLERACITDGENIIFI